ncbi:nicotinate-nucleotide--dimethylbenzimidazole phosphoribosyltransferase [Marinilabiliaceae bacterium JC017]|nr:nicotinate-nucleotide--dimethylbenzimidazole phosphoribosyltransferase [Marinilabiliaceae bacterium JC017]
MNTLKNLTIQDLHHELEKDIQHKIDQKTKPIGSLGQMERIAKQVALIQGTTKPTLKKPVMLTVASDHDICNEGVSPCPTEITWQQCLNFMNGGGGIGLFCQEYGFDLYVVDAGVNYDFPPHPHLIDAKVRKGSRNFLHEPAMTMNECKQALENGRHIVKEMAQKGSNVIGFGEMGIGNTSPASALLSVLGGFSVESCVGPGSGLTPHGVNHKAHVIQSAIKKHGISPDPIENLARFGGLEIATIAGGMLEAAAQRMVIITDGFITTSALLAAHAIHPKVVDYTFFAHQSEEQGHKKMVDFMQGEPILNLGFRLGEGTGAAVAYSIIKGSVAMLNRMTSFDEAEVFNTANTQ